MNVRVGVMGKGIEGLGLGKGEGQSQSEMWGKSVARVEGKG